MSTGTKTAIIVVALLGVVLSGFYYSFVRPILETGRDHEARQVRLLCETDFPALLGACRELSRRVVSGELKSGTYMTPEMTQFPEPIARLSPARITIAEDGTVNVEMYVNAIAGCYFGVVVYPDGYAKKWLGDRKLIEGLWYHDTGYRDDPNSYDREIDQLLVKSGKLKQP